MKEITTAISSFFDGELAKIHCGDIAIFLPIAPCNSSHYNNDMLWQQLSHKVKSKKEFLAQEKLDFLNSAVDF